MNKNESTAVLRCFFSSEEKKRIGGKFVYWYNIKYQRVGHLFQDRFKSEPIEDKAYLFTVLRYIHQNPIKAKFCENVGDYKFSSYNEYTDNNLETEGKGAILLTDEQARTIIKLCSGCGNVTEFQALPKAEQEKNIEEFKNRGLSIRQMVRLTGVSKRLVEKWLK